MTFMRFCRSLTLLILSVTPLLSASHSYAQKLQEATGLFSYDASRPFEMKEESAKKQEGVTIRDITYAAYNPERGRLKAYLVQPTGKGPFAGVVFFHWLGRPRGDRSQFLEESTALARKGVVSLLIQGNFPWQVAPTDGPTDRQRIIEQTIEVRRALDLLLTQPGVDPRRIAYVGHDYGAMYGAILSGIEKRVKAYALVAGMGTFSDWSLKYWPKTATKGKEVYQQAMKVVDPIRYIGYAAPAPLFFQFAKSDHYIPKATATAFFNAASKPKQAQWYSTIHEMNVEAARKDRRVWLLEQIGQPAKNR